MLSSIHPLGEEGRGNRYRVTAAAFIAGSTAGGTATGLLISLFGLAAANVMGPAQVRPVVLGGALTIVALMSMFGAPLPGVSRQVNENWLVEFRGWVYGTGFGFQLGAGVTTYIRSGAVLVWLVAIAVVASFGARLLAVAVAIGLVFGLVRGLTILSTRSVHSPEQLIAFHRRLQGVAA